MLPVTEKFVAREKFVVDTSSKAKVRISYLSYNFIEWFISGTGKIEDKTINISEVDSNYGSTLCELFLLMEKQGEGTPNVFLLDINKKHLPDILRETFYILDQNGEQRNVKTHWQDGGWSISASPVYKSPTDLDNFSFSS